MNAQALPALTETFSQILKGLGKAIGVRLSQSPVAVTVMLLLRARLERLSARFAALVARFEAGLLQRPRAPRPGRQRPFDPPVRPPDATRPPGTPSWFGWVTGVVPGSEVSAKDLRILLSRPEMAALLGAAPQAGRLLRPLCHMLGIEASLIPLPGNRPLPEATVAQAAPQATANGPPDPDPPLPVAAPPEHPIRRFWSLA